MKKNAGSRVGAVITRIFNVRAWFDWDRVKSFTLFLMDGLKRLFIVQEHVQSDSFNEVQKQFKLTDADLLLKQKALWRLSMIMLTVAFLIFSYAMYHFMFGALRAGMVSLVVMMIALVLAFRYHFWYFQIKKQKLGCTFKEWYRQGFLGEKE